MKKVLVILAVLTVWLALTPSAEAQVFGRLFRRQPAVQVNNFNGGGNGFQQVNNFSNDRVGSVEGRRQGFRGRRQAEAFVNVNRKVSFSVGYHVPRQRVAFVNYAAPRQVLLLERSYGSYGGSCSAPALNYGYGVGVGNYGAVGGVISEEVTVTGADGTVTRTLRQFR